MRRLTMLLLTAIFLFPTPILANHVIKVDQSFDTPSFLGYVEDEFIVVLTEEAALSAQKGGTKNNALAGISAFEGAIKRHKINSIKPQFPWAEKSVKAKSKGLAKYY